MKVTETRKSRRSYADTETDYDVTEITGISDEEVEASLKLLFRCRGNWCDNEITKYLRVSEDKAEITITTPWVD